MIRLREICTIIISMIIIIVVIIVFIIIIIMIIITIKLQQSILNRDSNYVCSYSGKITRGDGQL